MKVVQELVRAHSGMGLVTLDRGALRHMCCEVDAWRGKDCRGALLHVTGAHGRGGGPHAPHAEAQEIEEGVFVHRSPCLPISRDLRE